MFVVYVHANVILRFHVNLFQQIGVFPNHFVDFFM
jgi:hypothetical protein